MWTNEKKIVVRGIGKNLSAVKVPIFFFAVDVTNDKHCAATVCKVGTWVSFATKDPGGFGKQTILQRPYLCIQYRN